MKFVVFFSLWALASSVPLRGGIFEPTNWWGLQGTGQETNQLWQQERVVPILGQQNSDEQLKQQISRLLREGQVRNVLQQQEITPLQQGTPRIIAQQVAQLIVEQCQQRKQILIQQVIEQLQQQLQQQEQWSSIGVQSVTKQIKQVEIIEAIKQLQQIQRLVLTQVPDNQLTQTLEAAVEAQLVSQTIENQVGQFAQTTKIPVQTTEVFQNRVQKLVNQITSQEIQEEIARQERIVQQLQQQQQFVNKQKQQVQVQKLMAQQQSQSQQLVQQLVQQLEFTQQTLQQQEQQLLQQQLSRQVVIQQLQKLLIRQQDQIQQDTLTEQINEQISQVGNPLFQFDYSQVGNRMWTQVPRTQFTNLVNKEPEFTTRGLQLETNRPVVYGDNTMFDLPY